MDALECILRRRSVRNFRADRIDESCVQTLIDCGRQAATACNVQPWEFVAVADADTRRQLAELTDHGKFITEAPLCIAVFCAETKYYLEDGSAATQNILLAARALGLGSCWVAGDKKAYAGKITELLNVPSSMKLISLIAVGYTDELEPVCAKRPLNEVLHRERFR